MEQKNAIYDQGGIFKISTLAMIGRTIEILKKNKDFWNRIPASDE